MNSGAVHRREIVGLSIGPSEAETFWSLSSGAAQPEEPGPARSQGREAGRLRCSRGPQARDRQGAGRDLAKVPGSLGGLPAAVPAGTDRQLCCRWMRCALAHVPKAQHTMVAAALRQAFLQADLETARQTWRQVADQLRPRWPKLAALMDESEHDVLAYMAFPAQHRTKLHSTNPLERLDKEVKRRAA